LGEGCPKVGGQGIGGGNGVRVSRDLDGAVAAGGRGRVKTLQVRSLLSSLIIRHHDPGSVPATGLQY